MKRLLLLLLGTTLALSLAGCSSLVSGIADAVVSAQSSGEAAATSAGETGSASDAGSESIVADYDGDDLDAGAESVDTTITLEGDSIRVDGEGTQLTGTTLLIYSAGTYSISGTLNDGRIIVNSEDQDKVKLILSGASLTCSNSAPIYVFNAEKTVITLADGTVNSVTDAASYVLDDPGSGEPDAAIFSNDDLTINGGGSLTVTASYNNGIASDDDLKITGGTITVRALNDGLQGRDSIAVKDGTLIVNAGGDGLRANNDEEADQGTITIEGGNLEITAGADGVQAETTIAISGGTISIAAGGGSGSATQQAGWGQGPWGDDAAGTDSPDTTDAARGVQAGVSISITGGTIAVDAADDALHSDGSVIINGGQVTLASGDDGIHSETALTISGGELNVTQSYEGLESKAITVNAGTIHVVSSDDGMNASAGQGALMGGGRGGFGGAGDSSLAVNGGTIAVDATGDGLDINGPITMTAGTLIVHGPTSDGNGPVDYTGSFAITGGTFLAVGSAGMAQGPSTDSTQYSLMLTYSAGVLAGTMIHIQGEDGEDLLTFTPIREYQSVVFSSPGIENGATYVIYAQGSSTGTAVDGLYTGGTYTGGTELTTVTVSDIVTYVGSYGGGFMGGQGGHRPQQPGG